MDTISQFFHAPYDAAADQYPSDRSIASSSEVLKPPAEAVEGSNKPDNSCVVQERQWLWGLCPPFDLNTEEPNLGDHEFCILINPLEEGPMDRAAREHVL